MKKEELVELGLTDELATKIIEMHGIKLCLKTKKTQESIQES